MHDYTTILPGDIKTGDFHALMLTAIAPRPIAFVSSVDAEGNVNLAPFSFFNAFGSKPPVLVFSPARRVRDNTTKHTLENARTTRQVVVNVVNYAMVEQASLASCEYPVGTNEFVKAGFTEAPSTLVAPPRVAESPVAFECQVVDIVETGTEGGAGNLVICQIVAVHVRNEFLNAAGKLDTHTLDLVGRMGGDTYVRCSGEALFEVPKPNLKLGIGIDQLPEFIRHSAVLTGNDLARLANVEALPTPEQVAATQAEHPDLHQQASQLASTEALHRWAQSLLKTQPPAVVLSILLATEIG